MKKKLISLSVALLMIMQIAFPALAIEPKKSNQANAETEPQALSDTAFAEHTSTNDKADTKQDVIYDKEGVYNNLKYGISDGEVTITGYVSKPSGDLVIPEKIEGYPVTGIGDKAFYQCTSLTSVDMSNVQRIGNSVFYYCDSLTSVEMPNVKTIAYLAFSICTSLTSVEMPNVKTIGEKAFGYCKSLTSVVMPNIKELAGDSFSGTPWYENLTDEFAVYGDGVLVKYCGTAKEVTVPDNVKCVAGFYYNGNITSVSIPNVQIIGEEAFYHCNSLKSVAMPKVQRIGIMAFEYCHSLTSVDVMNVQTICRSAFEFCSSLTSVEMPNVQTISRNAFSCCDSLTGVEMPNIKELAGDSFFGTPWYENLTDEFAVFGDGVLVKYCGTAKEVTVPDNVKCVAGFYHNDTITSATMSNTHMIADVAFAYCNTITSVEIPNVETIGDFAFCYCESLKSVDMPNVETIGDFAFCECTSLMSVEMPNVETIGDEVFSDCDLLASVAMPNVQIIGEYAFDECSTLTSLEMPNVETIGNSAFWKCNSLTSVYMPKVQTIGENAFYSCISLTSMEMPKVQTIAFSAFENCHSLKDVEMPNVQIIDVYAFSDCNNLENVYMPNVETICPRAFWRCNSLRSVSMPNVEVIGSDAFYNCSLTSAYFYSDAPTVFQDDVFDGGYAQGFTIYYAKGTSGWSIPNWNRYTTKEFVPTGYYYVTFIDGLTGEQIAKRAVKDGLYALAPEPSVHEGYTFTGWDKTFSNVTENITVTALYEETSFHVVNFVDGFTGEIISTAMVEHGKTAVFPIASEHEGYTFTGWDRDGKNITGNTTITALYERSIYTVIFKDGLMSKAISITTVEHGKDAVFPIAPEHEGYTFTGWDTDGKNITSDMIITALYEINSYTVIFKDSLTGEVISTRTVEYGKDVTLPAVPEHEGYTFTGWDSDGKNITADTTITALYEKMLTPTLTTGDINGDDKINTADAVYLLKSAAGMLTLTSEQMQVADLNHDGKINTADAVLILRYAAGIITSFD